MRKLLLRNAIFLICCCGFMVQGQVAQVSRSSVRLVSSGPHHNVCEWDYPETNDVGVVAWKTSHYTQLETGLNRWQPPSKAGAVGTYVPASEEFSLTPDGAAATNGQHRVFVSGQLNQDNAIQIQLPSGEIIGTRLYGVAYYSPSTGESVMVAELKDCQGTLLPGNRQIVFEDALDGVSGSIRLSYTKSGFESDVILDSKLPPPSEWNLPDDSIVEVLTEFTQMPAPETEMEVLADGSADEAIRWNGMHLAHGKSFFAGHEEAGMPVKKRLLNLAGRHFLSEQVRYRDLEPKLQELPPAPQPPQEGDVQPMRHKVTHGRVLELRRAQNKSSTPMKMAMADKSPRGYVIDYQILLSQSNVTLCGGVTYYATGPIILSGNTVVENCTVKMTNGASIAFNGSVQFLSSSYAPALFLSKDDNSAGDIIPGSNSRPGTNIYAGVALDFNTGTNVLTMQHIRIANAQTAIRFWGTSGHVISHAQFCNCPYGISATNSSYALRNALFWNVQTNFSGSGSTVGGEHLTIDRANQMNFGQTLHLTNSLLVAVTNYGAYDGVANSTASDPSVVFQIVRSGLHYLANNSPYRGLATAGINPSLAASLKTMTTYPPTVLANTLSTATVLSPQVIRDTGAYDLGYHYLTLDVLAGPSTVYAPVILTNGVALGTLNNPGFTTGFDVTSVGTATALNRIARYSYVQECWSNFAGNVFLNVGGGTSRFRFTDFSVPVVIQPSGTTNTWCPEISFRDCQFHGCNIDLAQVSSSSGVGAFTNNLIERGSIYVTTNIFYNPYYIYMFNNLFRSTTIFLNNAITHETIQNNLFDGASESVNTFYLTSGYNAFTAGTVNNLGGLYNKTGILADYQVGPLGRYYYPTSGANLYTLKNAGSCTAASLGLYHYATTSDLAKEASTTDDIGFHWIATNANGNPLDSDGDTIPDYLEDNNGDGNGTNDVSDWQLADTDGDGLNDCLEIVNGWPPRTPAPSDINNLMNLRVYTPLK